MSTKASSWSQCLECISFTIERHIAPRFSKLILYNARVDILFPNHLVSDQQCLSSGVRNIRFHRHPAVVESSASGCTANEVTSGFQCKISPVFDVIGIRGETDILSYAWKDRGQVQYDKRREQSVVRLLWRHTSVVMVMASQITDNRTMKTLGNISCLNPLRPNDAILWNRYWTTLAQVVACCLTAPSHFMDQWWLITTGIPWHLIEINLTRSAYELNP